MCLLVSTLLNILMGRKQHWHFPHAMYHVILRGNNRHEIFLDNHDREQFLRFLENSIKKFACKVHAFCLMTNHVHLAMEINTLPLGKIIQNVAHGYACWFNRRYQMIGHVFQGRYKAVLVQNERYMLELCRYIHLNPLRANIVQSLEQYRWSSHLVYLGKQTISWLCTDLLFSVLSQNQVVFDKVDVYNKFIFSTDGVINHQPLVEVGADGKLICHDRLLSRLHQGVANLQKTKVELKRIIAVVCKQLAIEEKDLFVSNKNWCSALARAMIALCAQEVGKTKLSELAVIFGRSGAVLSNSLSRLRQRRRVDAALDGIILATLKELTQE